MIRREHYIKRLISCKHNGMIKIITGIRRCGKSVLLFDLFIEHLISEGVHLNHIIKVDLEDLRNEPLRDPFNLLRYIDSKMVDADMYYILLDEVQHVERFEEVLNSYLKVKNADVYVTGSNSKFLSKDVVTEFRGRGYEIKISPFTFQEFFSAFGGSKEDALREYLTYGGLPKLLDFERDEDKISYLQQIFATTYITDIKERYHIKSDNGLEDLLNIIASSIGGLTNPTKLANTFLSEKRQSISVHTVQSYIDIMQDVFLVEKSIKYDIKGKRYINTPFKMYYTDLGLRNARLNFRQFEVTHLMENLIYNELRYRGMQVDVGVVIKNEKNEAGVSTRRQLEVDFVCNRGNKRLYVQSALSLPTLEKQEQEVCSLKLIDDSFMKVVITRDPIKQYISGDGVVFINLFDFLLDENSLSF